MNASVDPQLAADLALLPSIGVSEDYIRVLDRIHRRLLPRTYVEVGVCTGQSLALSLPGTNAVGVDPEPRVIYPLRRSTKVVSLPSDEFFKHHSARDLFDGTPLDLAFIDGMHLFEFALRDFMNLERWCTKDSVIVVHDCYPISEVAAARQRTTGAWTGDVWKLVPCLKEFRPDLNISTVKAPPSGLCMITGLDPASTVLECHYEEICERFIGLDYGVIVSDTDGVLNAVENDWAKIRSLLPGQFRPGNGEWLALSRSLRSLRGAELVRAAKRSIPAPVKQAVRRAR